jgi:hypothetical protein
MSSCVFESDGRSRVIDLDNDGDPDTFQYSPSVHGGGGESVCGAPDAEEPIVGQCPVSTVLGGELNTCFLPVTLQFNASGPAGTVDASIEALRYYAPCGLTYDGTAEVWFSPPILLTADDVNGSGVSEIVDSFVDQDAGIGRSGIRVPEARWLWAAPLFSFTASSYGLVGIGRFDFSITLTDFLGNIEDSITYESVLLWDLGGPLDDSDDDPINETM